MQQSIPTYIKLKVMQMHPAYFGFVMATGIVSLSAFQHGLAEIGLLLSWINIVIYVSLWLIFIFRIKSFSKNVFEDLQNHSKAPTFFTIVAASSIFGSQLILVDGMRPVAEALWWVTLILWVFCTYVIFTSLTIKENKPPLESGINGGWLLAIVGTQSVALLGCRLDASFLENREFALFVLTSFWLFGGMLYIWIIGLIFYRYMFFKMSPEDILPPYWINMGAVAISTLAGELLSGLIKTSPALNHLHPFIHGLTIMFWATASWWIPMLLILGIWRHFFKRVPISYDPLYWGLVFPLGMYSICTLQLSRTLQFPILNMVSKFFILIALCVWFVTFLGYLSRLIHIPLFARELVERKKLKN